LKRPELAICLAAYEPKAALWRRQLTSLRAQTHQDWVCLIQDDASSPAAYARLRAGVRGDRRFVLRRNSRRLGFYRNFETALGRVPSGVRYVALCDQDDRWHPGKLANSMDLLQSSGAHLVHANMRLVDAQGRVLAPGNWIAGANARVDLESLCLANIVTGAGAVFRAELLEQALPFPAGPGPLYHDHWLALVALSLGDLAYLDTPQWDYVQHGTNTLGHGLPREVMSLRLRLHHFWQRWGAPHHRPSLLKDARHRHAMLLQGSAYAGELRRRLGARLKAGAARELALVQAAEHSLPALAWLWAHGARRGRDLYRIEHQLLEDGIRLRLEAFREALCGRSAGHPRRVEPLKSPC